MRNIETKVPVPSSVKLKKRKPRTKLKNMKALVKHANAAIISYKQKVKKKHSQNLCKKSLENSGTKDEI
jgi:hypothetical protein